MKEAADLYLDDVGKHCDLWKGIILQFHQWLTNPYIYKGVACHLSSNFYGCLYWESINSLVCDNVQCLPPTRAHSEQQQAIANSTMLKKGIKYSYSPSYYSYANFPNVQKIKITAVHNVAHQMCEFEANSTYYIDSSFNTGIKSSQ